MSPPEEPEPPVLQSFLRKDLKSVPGLPTRYCAETDERYFFWTDVQNAFEGVAYLTDSSSGGAEFLIDNDGELRRPLCFKYRNSSYILVCHRSQMCQQRESEATQGVDRLPTVTIVMDNAEIEGNEMDLALRDLDDLFNVCRIKNEARKSWAYFDRRRYQQMAASSHYYNLMLVKKMEILDRDGITVLAGGKNQQQILEELIGFEQQAHEWNNQNILWNVLICTENRWDFATSRLFVVLPSDLGSWKDSDPLTRQFRLYFLCDYQKLDHNLEVVPWHVHSSDHQGYSLKRPQEFIQAYGDYILRVLLMIRHGYSHGLYEVTPLETFNNIWNSIPSMGGNHFSKEILANLVDKTIAHLQGLSLPERNLQVALTRQESAAIRTYLDIQDGENAEGNLHRLMTNDHRVCWRCRAHSPQTIQTPQLKELQDFVSGHGGDIDMRLAKLRVELNSAAEAHRFRALLRGANRVFDISLKLCWPATRSEVQELGQGIGEAGTVTLEIEGISSDIYPGGYMQPLLKFFYPGDPPNRWLKYITLLNYPRPQERFIRIGLFSLRSVMPQDHTGFDWLSLDSDLDDVLDQLVEEHPGERAIASKKLQSVLGRYGFPDATLVTIYDPSWIAAFDVKQSAFVEAYSGSMRCPNAVLSSGSLQKLVAHIYDEEVESWHFNVAQRNALLQELRLSHFRDVLAYIERIIREWSRIGNTFTLTLQDRLGDTEAAQAAQMTVRGRNKDPSGVSRGDNHKLNTNQLSHRPQQKQDVPVEIEFLHWSCDHISTPVSNYLASILDMATRQHPSVLTSLHLDISGLSFAGMAAFQRILGRSRLEKLSVGCNAFDSRISNSIAQLLSAIRWDTLKSLVISGVYIDEWLYIWPSTTSPRLLCFEIRASESPSQVLSHLSVLFIHRTIYASSLMELYLENIQLQDECDWSLILDSLGPLCLKTFAHARATSVDSRLA